MTDALRSEIIKVIREDQVRTGELLSGHTTFRVGGPADTFLIPENEEEAVALLRLFSDTKEPLMILGNGSNLLISDKGYRGTVILMDHNLEEIRVEGVRIFAQAGAGLSRIAATAQQNALTGMEFASGIPGTLGGGIVMNAGAYGGEMKDIVETVTVYEKKSGSVRTIRGEDMDFSYRNSLVKQTGDVVLSAVLRLQEGDVRLIRERMDELKEQRVAKQPLEYASAGSTFKRPEGHFAGALIQDAGLKGFRVGGAQVSEKHAGFVINTGDATAEDIITLIREVRKRVYERSGVLLEPEVCMIGEDMTV
ncbi:MAG: UDP-N-acetylmuramate dehydrogenase [Lachnospiraceae bacterium]|nr:UDP-N-acetylmuramate dehydrogenase [Lachnospiraceae bacterium]